MRGEKECRKQRRRRGQNLSTALEGNPQKGKAGQIFLTVEKTEGDKGARSIKNIKPGGGAGTSKWGEFKQRIFISSPHRNKEEQFLKISRNLRQRLTSTEIRLRV